VAESREVKKVKRDIKTFCGESGKQGRKGKIRGRRETPQNNTVTYHG